MSSLKLLVAIYFSVIVKKENFQGSSFFALPDTQQFLLNNIRQNTIAEFELRERWLIIK